MPAPPYSECSTGAIGTPKQQAEFVPDDVRGEVAMDLISITEQVMKIAGLTEQEESVLRSKYRLDGAKPLALDQRQMAQTEEIALRKLQKVDFSLYI